MPNGIVKLWPGMVSTLLSFHMLSTANAQPNRGDQKCRTSLLLAAARSRRARDKLNISRVRLAWTRFFPLKSRHGWPERV